MIRKLLVVTALIGVINAQGLIAKGKAKLEEIETMVRDNAAKLTIKTPDSFSGGRQDMVKVTQMVKVRSEKTLLGIKGLRSTNTWAKFASIGDNVEVLGTLSDGQIIAAQERNIIVTSFHPELTDDVRFHKYFVSFVGDNNFGRYNNG